MTGHRILTEVSRNRLEKCLSVKAEAWARAVLRRTERWGLGEHTALAPGDISGPAAPPSLSAV